MNKAKRKLMRIFVAVFVATIAMSNPIFFRAAQNVTAVLEVIDHVSGNVPHSVYFHTYWANAYRFGATGRYAAIASGGGGTDAGRFLLESADARNWHVVSEARMVEFANYRAFGDNFAMFAPNIHTTNGNVWRRITGVPDFYHLEYRHGRILALGWDNQTGRSTYSVSANATNWNINVTGNLVDTTILFILPQNYLALTRNPATLEVHGAFVASSLNASPVPWTPTILPAVPINNWRQCVNYLWVGSAAGSFYRTVNGTSWSTTTEALFNAAEHYPSGTVASSVDLTITNSITGWKHLTHSTHTSPTAEAQAARFFWNGAEIRQPQVLPSGARNSVYSTFVPAPAGTSFSLISGSLPAGLHFNSNTGEIFGTPTQLGQFYIQIFASSAQPFYITYMLTIIDGSFPPDACPGAVCPGCIHCRWYFFGPTTGRLYAQGSPAHGVHYVCAVLHQVMPNLALGGFRLFEYGIASTFSGPRQMLIGPYDALWVFEGGYWLQVGFTGVHGGAIFVHGQDMTGAIDMMESYGVWNNRTYGAWYAWNIPGVGWDLQFFSMADNAPLVNITRFVPNFWYGIVHFPAGGEWALANPGHPAIDWKDDREMLEFSFGPTGVPTVTDNLLNTPVFSANFALAAEEELDEEFVEELDEELTDELTDEPDEVPYPSDYSDSVLPLENEYSSVSETCICEDFSNACL